MMSDVNEGVLEAFDELRGETIFVFGLDGRGSYSFAWCMGYLEIWRGKNRSDVEREKSLVKPPLSIKVIVSIGSDIYPLKGSTAPSSRMLIFSPS
jgi:hypothetical protein